jgi:hypothetical protein
MSIKATSVLRYTALLGVAVAALAMAPVAMAIDQGFAPRPDFPGPKGAERGYHGGMYHGGAYRGGVHGGYAYRGGIYRGDRGPYHSPYGLYAYRHNFARER